MPGSRVSYAVEGWTDEPVAERLIRHVGREPWRRYTARGASRLDPKLPGYNLSAERQPWLVLRDLDAVGCPSELIRDLIGEPAPRMALRIAVRQLESWLLADHAGFGRYFTVKETNLPPAPDDLPNAKRALVRACASSRRRDVRQAMVPTPSGRRQVGPEYEAWIRQFVVEEWDPVRASERSPSLQRTLERLRVLSETAWVL